MTIDRVLLVGLGSIGRRHLVNLRVLLPDAKIMVLRSRESSEIVDGCLIVSSLQKAIDFQPQVAFICNPSSCHIEVASVLAEADIHLFIEKPLSNNLERLDSFEAQVKANNTTVMVGYNLRFNPSLNALRELLISQKYGRALYVVAEVGQYLPDWRLDSDYRLNVSAKADLGGGALLELSHELDYLCWLFGDPIKASGQLMKVSDLDIDVEDLVMAQVDFGDADNPVKSSIHLDFLQRKPYRSCRVVCESATLVWNAIEDRLEIYQADEVTVAYQGDKERNSTYEKEIVSFLNAIKLKIAPPVSLSDGVRVMKLVDAIRKSSELARVVYL
jgi:predicted dehydrogenase